MNQKKIRVTVWNEYRHEKSDENVRKIYPNGIHGHIAKVLDDTGLFEVTTATLDEPEHGLTDEVLNNTEVMFWWGHLAHHEVSDEIVEKVHQRILSGMGIIFLHSAHHSKLFKKVLGTTGNLSWREDGTKSRVWVINPSHPIARGIGKYIDLPAEEMYGEPFGIPEPDELVFISWFKGGEVLRSGCTFKRGNGKIFYFQCGHETYPVYHNEKIKKVLINATQWANPTILLSEPQPCIKVDALEY